METGKIEIKTLVAAMAVVLALEAAAGAAVYIGAAPRLLVAGAARLAAIGLIALVVSIWDQGPGSIGLGRGELGPGLKKGLLLSVGFGLAAACGFAVMFAAGLDPLALVRMPLPKRALDLALFFIVGGLAAPVAEEMFFRGVVYGFLRRWGVVPALILSTLFFVLPHLPGPGLPLNQVIGGIIFALAYELTGSLMVPITVHALGNLAIFSLAAAFQ